MSEGRNIVIGILLGIILTSLLMFTLYQQAGLPEFGSMPVQEQDKRAAIVPKIPTVSYSVKPERLLPVFKPSPVAGGSIVGVAGPETGVQDAAQGQEEELQSKPEASEQQEKVQISKPEAQVKVKVVESEVAVWPSGHLPEVPDLSMAELQELSAAERTEYEQMLRVYRALRAEVLNLDQERQQLKQRMDKMFEENEVIERELEQIRAGMQRQKAQQATR